jgi:hypothetical protein
MVHRTHRFSWEPTAALHDGRQAFEDSPMKPLMLTAALALAAWLPGSHAQEVVPAPASASAPASAPVPETAAATPPELQPFVASYQAYNAGKLAGNATMRVVHNGGTQWRADLGIEGNRGFIGILGLNIQQSTVFDDIDNRYRPLTQSTVRKGLFLGKKVLGVYDWNAHSAQWQGDLKKDRRKPIPLQDGDMNGLLIDLAIIRDAQPGKRLQYRFVELGRARDHIYEIAKEPETVAVGELSYSALRVSRVNGGNDETIFWVADGVPTPVRILQRENGEDGIDLRLTEYQGVN